MFEASGHVYDDVKFRDSGKILNERPLVDVHYWPLAASMREDRTPITLSTWFLRETNLQKAWCRVKPGLSTLSPPLAELFRNGVVRVVGGLPILHDAAVYLSNHALQNSSRPMKGPELNVVQRSLSQFSLFRAQHHHHPQDFQSTQCYLIF